MVEWWVVGLFIVATGGAPLFAYWLASRTWRGEQPRDSAEDLKQRTSSRGRHDMKDRQIVSQWFDIRAPNGDLLARIKAMSYEAALVKFQEDEARRANSGAAQYGRAFPIVTGTVH